MEPIRPKPLASAPPVPVAVPLGPARPAGFEVAAAGVMHTGKPTAAASHSSLESFRQAIATAPANADRAAFLDRIVHQLGAESFGVEIPSQVREQVVAMLNDDPLVSRMLNELIADTAARRT